MEQKFKAPVILRLRKFAKVTISVVISICLSFCSFEPPHGKTRLPMEGML